MREGGPVAAGEDGGHEAPGAGQESRGDDGDNVAVHAVQRPGGNAAAHRARREPELGRLPQRDDGVLPRREIGQ